MNCRTGSLSALALLTVVTLLTAAAEPDLLEWSKNRKLTRADFKGNIAQPKGIAAQSFVAIRASWACDGGRFEPDIRAVFDRNKSTWAAASINAFDASNAGTAPANAMQLLQHEQTHFDIAELLARKLRRYFASLTEICTRPRGMVPLPAIVLDYQADLDEEQARYDRETIFGLDSRAQATWTDNTNRAVPLEN